MARTKGGSSRAHSRAHKDPEYENRMVTAIQAYREGAYTSLKSAADFYRVNKTTLHDRLNGKHRSTSDFSQSRQVLSPSQEQVLVDWVALQARSATPVDQIGLRRYARDLSGVTVGNKWARGFFGRHPELVVRKATKLDPKRRDNFNKTTVHHYFDLYEELHNTYGGIPPEHIWNMDEKGIQMGGGRKGSGKSHIFLRSMKRQYRVSSDNLELVTIIECVSAAGDTVPPAFILNEGPEPDLRSVGVDKVSTIGQTPTGWTNNEQAVGWLQKAFIPYTMSKRVDDTKPIVLVLDGHESHENTDLKREVYSVDGCDIIIVCFPSKCTHRLQPLDVVIFSPIGRAWRSHCDELHIERQTVNRYNVIQEYLKVRDKHMKLSSIQSAFRTTGLFPVNRNVFSDEDFAPSMSSSSNAHVPDSFPIDIPTSPPAIPSDIESDNDSEGGTAAARVQTCPFTQEELLSDDDSDSDFDMDDLVGSASESDLEEDVGNTFIRNNITLRASLLSKCLDFNDMLAKIANVPQSVDEAKSHLELLEDVRVLRSQVQQLCDALQIREASIQAANAHCTIIKRALEDVRQQLANTVKKKERGSKKVKARLLTLPELKAVFYTEEEERKQKEVEEASKEAQKAAETREQELHITEQANSRVFDRSLSFYLKSRVEIRIVARSLGIPDTGTKDNIFQLIDEHLKQHPELKTQERFAGLFLPKGTRIKRAAVPNHTTTPEVAQSNNNPMVAHQYTHPPVFLPHPSFPPAHLSNFYAHTFRSDAAPYNNYSNIGSSTNQPHYFNPYPH